jgi:hypothetical protein
MKTTSFKEDSDWVSVADILPFWRYAVGPTSQRNPAIPFWSIGAAMSFFDEAKRDLPWAGVRLYRRKLLRGIETIKEYTPTAKAEYESPSNHHR